MILALDVPTEWPWVLALSFPGTLVVAWLAGRMLGVRRSMSLTLLSGTIGWVAGVALSLSIADQKADPSSGFIRNVVLFSAFGAMSTSVWIEFLARPGALARAQSGLSTIPHPMRSARRRTERVRRYAQITRIAARHGLTPAIGMGRSKVGVDEADRRAPTARRLRNALEEAGGMFVKLGQVLSTRADLVSDDVARELSNLQDHVRPASREDVAAVLEEELEAAVEDMFAEFDWEPVAAASIGQAHRAKLPTGETVIVKVQRPGIAESVLRDLDALTQLAHAVETRTSWGADYGVVDLTREFGERLREELDYRIEARNALEIATNLPPDSAVRIPRVYAELTTPRVLVMEWLDGRSVRDAGQVAAVGADRKELADTLLRTMLQQMLVDGRYHADPHPGNVMVLSDGHLGLIDFGATGVVDPLQQAAIRDVMVGVSNHDPEMLRQALLRVATLRRRVDDEDLERSLARFMARHLGPGAVTSPAMFNDLLRLVYEYGINLPAELSTFFRALITLDGTLTTLAPGYQTIEAAERIAKEWISSRITAESMQDVAREELIRLAPMLRRLPSQIDRMFTTAQRDGVRVRASLFADERDVRVLTLLVNRFVLALSGGAVGLVSVLLISIHGGPGFAGSTSLFRFFGYFGLFCATVLIMRVLVAILRDGLN
jgi:ubiquinone biosynthesis protein